MSEGSQGPVHRPSTKRPQTSSDRADLEYELRRPAAPTSTKRPFFEERTLVDAFRPVAADHKVRCERIPPLSPLASGRPGGRPKKLCPPARRGPGSCHPPLGAPRP